MKIFFYILIILGLISCQSNNNQKVLGKEKNSKSKDLIGTWGLSNYLDSIVATKEVAKYRLQSPSWFGILIEIEEDSIKTNGSIIEIETKLLNKKDTLAIFDSWVGKWMLLKKQKNLILKQFPNQENIDSSIYTYNRRDDLKEMTEHLDSVNNFSSSMTKYLNKEIISGTYLNLKTTTKVVFLENGKLNGIGNFTEFEVRNYFGTLHPHKNLDVLFLINETEDLVQHYNWRFEDNNLVLTKFENEIINRNGKDAITDDFVLGKETIKLKKVY
ncbi:MAG: hypothetical protein P1U56_25985 [Saprospiraceae bacterium]|nr:hypothetical protein [Saprospiraceae bacterium]